MRYLTSILLSAATLFGVSCIHNDIPYPLVELNIDGVEGEGFTLAEIDVAKRVVTLTLNEQTDIENVHIDKVTLNATPHSTSLTREELLAQARVSRELTGTFDMRSPLYVTLSLYQDYDWAIVGEQTIERRFDVAGQVGATVFDLQNRTATAYVAKDADRTKTTITGLKLGAADITSYSPTAEELSKMNFESMHFVDVTCHGRTERWMLYVLPTNKSVSFDAADAWSKVVWLYGTGIEGITSGFRYRKQGTDTWEEVTNITTKGGSFSGHIDAEPETSYEIKAYCGTEETDSKSVTTDGIAQLPNSNFDAWCTIPSSSNKYEVVYPYAADATPFWGTGNVGAGVAKVTLTEQDTPHTGAPSGTYSAALRSKFANIAGIGKFAAGNLFTGKYVRNAVTDGIITFGRAFTLRPTAIRFWVKYNCGEVDKIKKLPAGSTLKLGDNDNGLVYIMLGTWTAAEYGKDSEGKMVGTDDSPYCIDTRDESTFIRPGGKDMVAYGEYLMTESVTTWQQVTVPITYVATDRIPTHVLVVGTASRLGDYFSGSTKSELWIDDLELLYDWQPPTTTGK